MSLDSKARTSKLPDDSFYETLERIKRNKEKQENKARESDGNPQKPAK